MELGPLSSHSPRSSGPEPEPWAPGSRRQAGVSSQAGEAGTPWRQGAREVPARKRKALHPVAS